MQPRPFEAWESIKGGHQCRLQRHPVHALQTNTLSWGVGEGTTKALVYARQGVWGNGLGVCVR